MEGDPRKHKEKVGQVRYGRRAIKVNTNEWVTNMGSKAQSLGDLPKTVWLAVAAELCQWKMLGKGPGKGWGMYLANATPQSQAFPCTALCLVIERGQQDREETGCWE